jgi:hypothetical protein
MKMVDCCGQQINILILVCFKVLEQEISLIQISDDEEYVTLMIPKLRQIYLANTGINVKINIDKSIKLPIQEMEDVVINDKGQRLIVENTLVVRLLYLAQQVIPIICTRLFEPNPIRSYLRDTLLQNKNSVYNLIFTSTNSVILYYRNKFLTLK